MIYTTGTRTNGDEENEVSAKVAWGERGEVSRPAQAG